MTIFRVGNDQLDVRETGAISPSATGQSGPSNLCYNPFGSRGDGTFRRHSLSLLLLQPAAEIRQEEEEEKNRQ